MWTVYRSFITWFDGLNRDEVFLTLLVVMIVGFLCMRGFGSRSSY